MSLNVTIMGIKNPISKEIIITSICFFSIFLLFLIDSILPFPLHPKKRIQNCFFINFSRNSNKIYRAHYLLNIIIIIRDLINEHMKNKLLSLIFQRNIRYSKKRKEYITQFYFFRKNINYITFFDFV